MSRLMGKIALVTGGAKGIGAATADLFTANGATVVLTDRDGAAGSAAVAALAAKGRQAEFLTHDVADEADWERVLSQTLARFGRLDVLVNNAGIAFRGSVEETSLEDWRRIMAVNLDGVFLGTKHGIRAMKSHGGSIINLSSVAGLVGDADLAAYNASKGGVRLLTKSAALHCASAGYEIRVNSVHPGYILTPMVQAGLDRSPDTKAAQEYLANRHPVGRLGRAEDVANGILYLASDESRFVTGSELVIDGGYTAW